MNIDKAAAKIGTVVTGIDVNRMSEAEWQKLYAAWLDHAVLVVRGQELDVSQFVAYSRRFGRLKPHRVRKTRHPLHPEVTLLGFNVKTAQGKVDETAYKRGVNWHTDSSWDSEVCKATQLYGVAIPSRGGDTLFASMYEAYEGLPDPLKRRIEGLQAEFVYSGPTRKAIELLEPEDRDLPPAVHPLVRVHSETGRKALYLDVTQMVKVVGMSVEDSQALMAELSQHMLQPGAQYRHRWQVGDIVIWDNRCSIHAATGDYPVQEARHHWRTTIMEQ